MTRKKNKKPGSASRQTKAQAQVDPLHSVSAQQSPEVNLKTAPQLAHMQPVYSWEDSPRPAKRQKTTYVENTEGQPPNNTKTGAQQEARQAASDGVATSVLSTDQLPSELHHLQKMYDFTTMSIISSSKMEQKVRNLLLRIKAPVEGTKPGIVILTAKADVASKLVGIVEIAKRTIQQESGHWWQYSKLHPQIVELKEKKKKPKRPEGGMTLREWADGQLEQKENVSQESDGKQDTTAHAPAEDPSVDRPEEDEDEDEEAFQTMGRHQVMAYDENKSKIRAVAIMTVYLSQVPVPALKDTCR